MKKAIGNSYLSQRYFELFYFERILERISKSRYKNHIILKGGLLLTSIIGNDDRTTKDMDATLKGYPLNNWEVVLAKLRKYVNLICNQVIFPGDKELSLEFQKTINKM